MFKYLLSSVEYFDLWSIITLIIFFVAFILLIVYTFKFDKSFIEHMSNLPLNDSEDNKIR